MFVPAWTKAVAVAPGEVKFSFVLGFPTEVPPSVSVVGEIVLSQENCPDETLRRLEEIPPVFPTHVFVVNRLFVSRITPSVKLFPTYTLLPPSVLEMSREVVFPCVVIPVKTVAVPLIRSAFVLPTSTPGPMVLYLALVPADGSNVTMPEEARRITKFWTLTHWVPSISSRPPAV